MGEISWRRMLNGKSASCHTEFACIVSSVRPLWLEWPPALSFVCMLPALANEVQAKNP